MFVRVVEPLSVGVQSKVEHKMVELKARVDNLDVVRRKLISLGVQRIGKFRQSDVYFGVPEGRLKLREVEGSDEAELIYYERENVAGPKGSDVFVLKIQNAEVFKDSVKRLLETSGVVKKVREIFRYQGTRLASKRRYIQIHLDDVKKLGTFIEFEMKSSDQTEKTDKQILESLMKELEIKAYQLQKHSYLDLLRRI
jgi:adenylate cyclase class 2